MHRMHHDRMHRMHRMHRSHTGINYLHPGHQSKHTYLIFFMHESVIYAFYVFHAWWIYFPQSGALTEGTSWPLSHQHHSQDSILISTNQDPQSSRHLMSPFGKDETGHASPAGTILPFTLHITGSIPHRDIHILLGYEPFLLLLLLSLPL